MVQQAWTPMGSQLVALTPVQPRWLSAAEERRLRMLAWELEQDDAALQQDRERYRALQAHHMPKRAPQCIVLDDFSSVSGVQDPISLAYTSTRAFIRARERDVVMGTFPEVEGYIDYMAERLQLGRSHFLPLPPASNAPPYDMCEAFLTYPPAMKALGKLLNLQAEELWLHPFMGHHKLWHMAEKIQQELPPALKVLAPMPEICEHANNKVWFAKVLRRVLGEKVAIPGQSSDSAPSAAHALRDLARQWSRVTLKLANSAAGRGTLVLSQEEVLAPPVKELEERIQAWLKSKGWHPEHSPPLVVEAWLPTPLGSPSVQLWLPPSDVSPPLVEGICDQVFDPDNPIVFQGNIPSQLPQHIQQYMRDCTVRLGRVFQHLGYVGRCSFDAILCGDDPQHAKVRFVECNGRWGGTSIPMLLMNRLFHDYRSQPYIASGFIHPKLKDMPFADFVRIFHDILWDRRSQHGWAIVYNVGKLAPYGRLDIITLGKDILQVQERQEQFQELVEKRL